jgi:hypothetical protein
VPVPEKYGHDVAQRRNSKSTNPDPTSIRIASGGDGVRVPINNNEVGSSASMKTRTKTTMKKSQDNQDMKGNTEPKALPARVSK